MEKATLATEVSKYFERQLRNFGATGKGLHEMTNSLSQFFPQAIIEGLFRIARERNRVIHDDHPSWNETNFLREALFLATRIGDFEPQRKNKIEGQPTIVPNELPSAKVCQFQGPEKDIVQIGKPLTDDQIISFLKGIVSSISEEELEDVIDEANSEAMASCNHLSERWHAFQFLAQQESKELTERLRYFALAFKAGASTDEIVEALSSLPMDFLRYEFESFQVGAAFS